MSQLRVKSSHVEAHCCAVNDAWWMNELVRAFDEVVPLAAARGPAAQLPVQSDAAAPRAGGAVVPTEEKDAPGTPVAPPATRGRATKKPPTLTKS